MSIATCRWQQFETEYLEQVAKDKTSSAVENMPRNSLLTLHPSQTAAPFRQDFETKPTWLLNTNCKHQIDFTVTHTS